MAKRPANHRPDRHHSADIPADVSKLKGWTKARQILDPVTTKIPTRRVTINIDQDLIAIFKAEALAGGPPYQVALNQALRSYLRQRDEDTKERAAEIVLAALENRAVRRKIRAIRNG